jgi:hypothetical protein
LAFAATATLAANAAVAQGCREAPRTCMPIGTVFELRRGGLARQRLHRCGARAHRHDDLLADPPHVKPDA